MDSIEIKGKTEEQAIEIALDQLGCEREDVDVEVVQKASGGFLGLGAQEAVVKVSIIPRLQGEAIDLLEEIVSYFAPDTEIHVTEDADEVDISLEGDDIGILIGKRGATLNAIEYLINIITNKKQKTRINVKLDAANYRENRKQALEKLSSRLADKVSNTGRSVELEPMSSRERKMIHIALKEREDVYTYSKGDEPYRKIVISAKKKDEYTLKDDRYAEEE